MTIDTYKTATRRLILLDYDGTLTPLVALPELARPKQRLLDLLQNLSADRKNTVYIISGRDRDTLGEWLGELSLNLVAEHGAWIKTANGEWQTMSALTTEWIAPVEELMQRHVEHCPGSFIENKSYSVAWHYRLCDKTEAVRQATDLLQELEAITEELDIDLIDGNKVIEVRNKGISKGRAVKNILEQKDFDFILACGDDTTDEDMFRELAEVEQAVTIKVGEQESSAKIKLADTEKILDLLGTFTGAELVG